MIDCVEDEEKLRIASIHLLNKALIWHQRFIRIHGEAVEWKLHVEVIEKRFGSNIEDPLSELKNLKQISTIQVYYDEFERLLNKLEISEKHAISLFLAGLQKEIKLQVRMFMPKSLEDAYTLAKLQEDTLSAVKRRYSHSHKCSGQMFSLEVLRDGESEEISETDIQANDEIGLESDGELNEYTPHISLNALTGTATYQTMRVMGQLNGHMVHILIDSKSTHNFLDISTAKRVGCQLKQTTPMQVAVPGGNKIMSSCQVNNISWLMRGHTFSSDMVGKRVELKGTNKPLAEWLVGRKLTKMVDHQPAHLNAMTLCVYHTQLPPSRTHDHKIVLKEGTGPINIRPYRHPPSQKDAIESMVKELLESGVIRPSQSPFSSPIVMVKKKDGSWRMCVDYRELNKHTIKDRFPIPVIEELIDELHGSQVFSKLDLRSGYHQIRMNEQEINKTAFSSNEVDHVYHLELVLETMRRHTLFAKRSKCVFGVLQVEYLGHIISREGVATEPSKNEAAQDAFNKLKLAMQQARILALPDFNEEFTIETDASGMGIGALDKWRGYLLDRHFKIKTDHVSLKYLMDQRFSTPTQMKWLPKLMGYDYEIVYKQGCDNVVVYALSRVEGIGTLFQIHVTNIGTDMLARVQASVDQDVDLQQLITKLQQNGNMSKLYVLGNGRLTRKGKLVVGNDSQLRLEILNHYHTSSSGGHTAINTTLFEVVCGQSPPSMVSYHQGDSLVDTVDRTLLAREQAIALLKYHLQRAQARMKHYADAKRQSTLRGSHYHKLSPKYFGPFLFLAKIGQVAYKLQLPTTVQIHPKGITAEPVKILDRKLMKRGDRAVIEVLVQWQGGTVEDATWELIEDFMLRYP
ncbi:uncharacterized protein [Rutidosis leptorrhynchoides]|uniref:uncharacterized protein n=1 Tax=Rutidosis leptorrhynchoides TaxID=125765 RepID=UPI003A98F3A0